MPRRRLARLALLASFSALAVAAPALAQDATPVDENLAPDASPATAGPPLPPGFTSVAAGLDNARDLAFGPDGSLYVLRFNRDGIGSIDPEDPSTLERVLHRVYPDGTRTEVAGPGPIAPTSVLVADDGTLYPSVFGVLPGAGQVLALEPDVADAGTPIPATPAPQATPVA
jgi:hypothetical protein